MRFFRPASARVTLVNVDEAPALADLYQRAWTDCDDTLDQRLVDDQRASLEDVRAWLSGGFEVYKTTHDGRVAGALRCSFPSSTCHLDRLAVDPELRRQGHGHSLVAHGVVRARRAGVSRVWVELCPKLQDTLELFKHLGFREAGRYHAGYWGEPVLLMELGL